MFDGFYADLMLRLRTWAGGGVALAKRAAALYAPVDCCKTNINQYHHNMKNIKDWASKIYAFLEWHIKQEIHLNKGD